MKRLRCALWSLLFFCVIGTAQAQEGTDPILVTDLLKIQQLGAVTASPDGRFVAYTARTIVEKPDAEGEYTYRSHLWVIPVSSSGVPQQLTHGDRGASQPAWHPDGDRIAFVRPVDGTSQIFLLPIYGGEAQQLTDFEHGASAPQWSPDGHRLLFSASLPEDALRTLMDDEAPSWSDERPGRTRNDLGETPPDPDGSLAEIRAWLAKNRTDNNPRVFNRLNLQGETRLAPRPTFRHYFVLDTDRDDAEPMLVTRGYYSFGGAEWLPDSQQLLFHGVPEEADHPDRERDTDLYLVDVDTGRIRHLLDIEGYALSSPRLSPDGNLIAFLARDLNDPGYAQTELGTFNLDGHTPPELLTLGFDRSLNSHRWSQDNWFLFFTAPSEGGFPLYRLPVHLGKPARPTPTDEAPADTLAADSLAADSLMIAKASFTRGELVIRSLNVERLTNPEHGIRSYDITTATAYYVLTEIRNPFEMYAANMDFTQQRRLTEHNVSWLKNKRLSEPEAFTLRRDTLQTPYWVMRPTFYERGQKYPMLLEIHGGPAAMWGPGEATMWHEFQFLAAQGYGIVFSNPRGSGGYGHAYKRLNYQDWGDGPGGDVLAVATEAARRQRWVDMDRQVVTGGSYAGYLTAWIVGHDHRFKAAVAQRGVYDLATFFGEGRAWWLVPNHFGGYPWEDEAGDILDYNSPQTYVNQIRTPLLIMHGDDDLRTGVIQSEVLYKSLKALNRPVEYIRYPGAAHDLSRSGDPKQRIDRLLRIYEFMERYIGDDAEAPSAGDSQ
ncbi:MAG: prolyl oligopeptidase family serine peptidase [Rhodothermales bacterium]